jgi:exosome complex RNA-binding protein Csl4
MKCVNCGQEMEKISSNTLRCSKCGITYDRKWVIIRD